MRATESRPLILRQSISCPGARHVTLWSRRKTLTPCVAVIDNWRRQSVPSWILHNWPSITHVIAVGQSGPPLILDAVNRGPLCFGRAVAQDAYPRFDGNWYLLPQLENAPYNMED